MITSRASVSVRYAETDMMGVVYHGSYLPWLEIGRTQLLKDHGIPYRVLEAEGFFLPVVEVSLRYLRPAKYDDEVVITTVLKEKPSLRIRMEYQLHRGDELIATATSLHVFIDRSGKPVRPPAAFVQMMDRVFG
ncbi:MAG: acyl-CoA thioesterase [Opitutus sp.]|nr:acyl-CoA thioesterase [Opitutus sp.]MCS6248300.1 acyl-CoA thioesterase [Opitutus sp.]MCS6275010.1 acyl-CoA thioesterase [Opitutus sp.]MCS6277416.1 acyl-CoA thioesterase [Opitutus sp.]MCS6300533.1 acyl-CoA thioesterase [Opitutus sp.]